MSQDMPAEAQVNYRTPAPINRTDAQIIDILSSAELQQTPPEIISLLSSAESTCRSKQCAHTVSVTASNSSELPDAGVATPIPIAVRTTDDIPSSPTRPSDEVARLSPDSDGNMCGGASTHNIDPFWSLADLEKAPATIARVQQLISHLMYVGIKSVPFSTHHERHHRPLTHAQHTRHILNDQCHTMLKGLHDQLHMLFKHFSYSSSNYSDNEDSDST